MKQERSHSIVEATTHELAKKLDASEKRFEVMETAIGRLESTITHLQRKQDQIVSKQDQIFSSQDQIQSTLCSAMPNTGFKSPPSHVSWSPRSLTPVIHHGIYNPVIQPQLNPNPYDVGSMPSLISSDPELQSLFDVLPQEDQAQMGSNTSTGAVAVDLPLFSSLPNQDNEDMSFQLGANQSQPPLQANPASRLSFEDNTAKQPAKADQPEEYLSIQEHTSSRKPAGQPDKQHSIKQQHDTEHHTAGQPACQLSAATTKQFDAKQALVSPQLVIESNSELRNPQTRVCSSCLFFFW